MMGADPGKERAQRLPPLPQGFWNLCQGISGACRGLLQVLHAEWQALRHVELARLWKISEEKERRVERIREMEEMLNSAVDRILERCGVPGGRRRWARLLALLHDKDVETMQKWLADTRAMKKEIKEINARHLDWLDGQVRLTRNLTSILLGRDHQGSIVYGPGGRLANRIYGGRSGAGRP